MPPSSLTIPRHGMHVYTCTREYVKQCWYAPYTWAKQTHGCCSTLGISVVDWEVGRDFRFRRLFFFLFSFLTSLSLHFHQRSPMLSIVCFCSQYFSQSFQVCLTQSCHLNLGLSRLLFSPFSFFSFFASFNLPFFLYNRSISAYSSPTTS